MKLLFAYYVAVLALLVKPIQGQLCSVCNIPVLNIFCFLFDVLFCTFLPFLCPCSSPSGSPGPSPPQLTLDFDALTVTQNCGCWVFDVVRPAGTTEAIPFEVSFSGDAITYTPPAPVVAVIDAFQVTNPAPPFEIENGVTLLEVVVCPSPSGLLCFSNPGSFTITVTGDGDLEASQVVNYNVMNCGKCRREFRRGLLELDSSPETYRSVIESQGGNMTGHHKVYYDLITEEERQDLVQFLDQEQTDDMDFMMDLGPMEFGNMLSLTSLSKIQQAANDFGFAINSIRLRRSHTFGDTHMAYHHDGSFVALHIKLSMDDGGDFVCVSENGLTLPEWPLRSGVAHAQNVVHGLTSFDGVRHVLILYGNKPNEDVLKDIIVGTTESVT